MLGSCSKVIEQKRVFVTRSVVNLDSHKIAVRVLNPSDEPQRLYRKTILGLCGQIKKTEFVNIKTQSIETKIASDYGMDAKAICA